MRSYLIIPCGSKKVNGQAFDWWAGNENKNLKLEFIPAHKQ